MTFAKSAFLASALALASGITATTLSNEASAQSAPVNWNLEVKREGGAHFIGNPNAEAKLTEYVSYTCGHCATFAAQGDPALKLVYIPTGKISLEVRHLIRDPIDWTVAVLAHCGDPKNFVMNHAAFMAQQETWLGKARNATQGQMERWQSADRTAARKAIAADLDLDDMMERRGYSRVEINTCLADDLAARTLVIQSNEEANRMGVNGTPSFALNGKLLEGAHSWPALQSELDGHLNAKKGQ